MGCCCSPTNNEIQDLKFEMFRIFVNRNKKEVMNKESGIISIQLNKSNLSEDSKKSSSPLLASQVIYITIDPDNKDQIQNRGFYIEDIWKNVSKLTTQDYQRIQIKQPKIRNKNFKRNLFRTTIEAILGLDRRTRASREIKQSMDSKINKTQISIEWQIPSYREKQKIFKSIAKENEHVSDIID